MKILLCTNAFENVTNGPAKAAHLLMRIHETFPACEVKILTEDVGSNSDGGVYKQILHIPAVLKFAGMFLRMFQYHKTAFSIKKHHYNFDVLVYNNVIIALWSALFFKNTVGFVNDDNNLTVRWRDILMLRWSKAHIFFFVEMLACKYVKKVIVNSDYLLNTLHEKYRIPKNKIYKLYKAIEIVPKHIKKNNDIPVILFVKNDYKRGGIFTLIDALKMVKRKVKLIIAGTPKFAESEFENALCDTHIDYEILGIQPQQSIYALMTQADVFCVPSYKEALGVANMEALALGCAVVSTQVGGIPEVLDNGNCGWLVEPANAQALAYAIEACLDNDALRNMKAENSIIYLEKFTVENMYKNFIDIVSK